MLSSPPPNDYFVSKPLDLNSCHGNQKAKFLEKKNINQLLRSYMGDKAKTLQKCS